MTDALKYEWTRLRTLRSTWWITAIAASLSILATVGLGFGLQNLPTSDPDAAGMAVRLLASAGASGGVPFLFAYLIAMVGVFAWGHEYRHGMIRATLTAQNSRPRAWVAKFVVVGLWVVVTWFVTGLLGAGIGGLISGHGLQAESWSTMGRAAVYALLVTWVAMAFTALVRQQILGLVMLFVWPFLIETIVTTVVNVVPALRENLIELPKYLPFEAAKAIVFDGGMDAVALLSPWQGFGLFGGFAAVLMLASLLLFNSRDA